MLELLLGLLILVGLIICFPLALSVLAIKCYELIPDRSIAARELPEANVEPAQLPRVSIYDLMND